VNAVIPAGKTTAIIGFNGSGKSTLIKLIDRLYPSDGGELSLGEDKAEGTSLSSWRSQFGLVSQDAHLFSGSLRSNINYGLAHPLSEEELASIVKRANLESVVSSHSEGLDYDIGIKGCHLSGGEQQRVAIARALAKNPNYLILDEATANLDAKTETEVKAGLAELMKGRTVIMVAHQYSTIKDADNVLVMDHGKIVDSGALAEVKQRCELLQQMENNL
jgi:ATP-binding cassette subfamily B protein AbcA/BmrA